MLDRKTKVDKHVEDEAREEKDERLALRRWDIRSIAWLLHDVNGIYLSLGPEKTSRNRDPPSSHEKITQ